LLSEKIERFMDERSKALLEAPAREGSKIDLQTLIRCAYNFAAGLPLDECARLTGLPRKTVREITLEFRECLLKPEFNAWHQSNRMLVHLPDSEQEALVRASFFDVMAECYGHATCYRNFKLGNRKNRQCRTCPLAGKFTDEARVKEALEAIDAVHAFYAVLGLRGEKDLDPVSLFRRRLIHTVTIMTARENTKGLASISHHSTDQGSNCIVCLAKQLLK